MTSTYEEILHRLARPMEPEATGARTVLRRLEGVRAVLFDVYGTLFLSGSGEVGATRETVCRHAIAGALESLGARQDDKLAADGVHRYLETIDESHARSREQGIEHPEVNIVEIWRRVVAELSCSGWLDGRDWNDERLKRLAVEYEGRVNPVWPMPGIDECLADLSGRGLALGIVSNAQFYTPLLFGALLGKAAESLGFDPELQFYSYRFGQAKPGLFLHRRAIDALARRGIPPGQTLYVGNDMLNDVWPAAGVGFRTALFAGDARSLRLREDDWRLEGVSPDLVLTRLLELNGCV
jgi:putative hydrolase of the HAD superfamily